MMDWREYLHGRGISEATIERYGIKGGNGGRPSIVYPTIGMAGAKATRVKFIDGNKPKNIWQGDEHQNGIFRYYSPGKMGQAIANDSGKLYWLSGEPDVWTWYETTSMLNATCTFGEGSVPETVAEDLKFLNVQRVIMYPDLDEPGMKAAGKLWRYLEGSGIGLIVLRIPGTMDSKRDLNQIWKDVKGDLPTFENIIEYEAEIMAIEELELYAPAVKPDEQPRLDLDFGGMYHQWIEEVIHSLGHWDTREGNTERWHCPLPGHDDEHPSFRVASGSRCKMPMCTCNIQDKDPTDAWNEVARARNVDTWDEYKTRQRASAGLIKPMTPNPPSTNGAAPAASKSSPTDYSLYYDDSHTIFNQILDHLEGKNLPDVEYVENPFKVLHQFGGFAEIMFPGKLVYIVGISGGFKTSLGENYGEAFLRTGYDFVWFGPEWDTYQMGLRALQRSGGLDMIHMAKAQMWDSQAARGVPEDKRRGIMLREDERAYSAKLIYDMARWPGRACWLNKEANKLPLTDMLNMVRGMVNERRAAGRKVVAFFFDYLQRANKPGRDGAFWSEAVIAEIKALCEELQLIGFVMVQPKKGDGEDVRSGVDLNEASGQGISDQQCNLYLAVHPVFEDGIRTGYGKIGIVKNSMGTLGDVMCPIDAARLSWTDREVHYTNIDLSSRSNP